MHENPLKQSALFQVMHTEPAVKGTAANADWLWHASKAHESLSMNQAYDVLQSSALTFMMGHRMFKKTVIFLTQFWWAEHQEVLLLTDVEMIYISY